MKKLNLNIEINKKMFVCFAIELLLSGVYLAFDLLTKQFIYTPIANGTKTSADFIHIDGIIRFVAVENTGASFGIFTGNNSILAIVSVVAMVALICFMFFSGNNRNMWLRSALVLMLAGGIGNTVDRLLFGYVRDMVYFELIDFAVFNFADSGLVIGCILLVIFVIFYYKPDEKKTKESGDK